MTVRSTEIFRLEAELAVAPVVPAPPVEIAEVYEREQADAAANQEQINDAQQPGLIAPAGQALGKNRKARVAEGTHRMKGGLPGYFADVEFRSVLRQHTEHGDEPRELGEEHEHATA